MADSQHTSPETPIPSGGKSRQGNRNPNWHGGNDDMLLVFRGVHGRCNPANIFKDGRFVRDGESSMDLVTVKREPVLRAWTWQQLGQHRNHFFRRKTKLTWWSIEGVSPSEFIVYFASDFDPIADMKQLRDNWECTPDPFVSSPAVLPCGVIE